MSQLPLIKPIAVGDAVVFPQHITAIEPCSMDSTVGCRVYVRGGEYFETSASVAQVLESLGLEEPSYA